MPLSPICHESADLSDVIVSPPPLFGKDTLPSVPEADEGTPDFVEATINNDNSLDFLATVSLPAKSRQRGCPKGSVTTAIGLRRANKRK